MSRYAWTLGLAALTLLQVAGAEAGTLQLQVESGRVRINAHAVPLGQILEALSERTGIRVIIDEDKAAERVSAVIEAEGVREALSELLRRTGGGTYVILYTDDMGYFETFRVTERGKSTPSAEAPLRRVAEFLELELEVPRFIPPRTEPVYQPPASPPVHVPEAAAPVYLPPVE